VRIFIPGEPIAQPRPKVSTRGGFARAYVDKKHPCHMHKQAFRTAWIDAQGDVFQGPVEFSKIVFLFSRPESHSKKRRLEREPKTTKPDLDNLIKLIFDALNGIAYNDDNQICRIGEIEKWYVGPNDQVGTWIDVRQ